MRITMDVPDLQPGITKSATVAKYVRAAIKVQALRKEFAQALIDLRACKQAICNRAQPDSLMAEAQALCEELHIDPGNR